MKLSDKLTVTCKMTKNFSVLYNRMSQESREKVEVRVAEIQKSIEADNTIPCNQSPDGMATKKSDVVQSAQSNPLANGVQRSLANNAAANA